MSVSHPDIAGDRLERKRSPWRYLSVALTQTSGDTIALELAGDLARKHDARLDVLQLMVMPSSSMFNPWAIVADPGFAQIYTDLREMAQTKASTLRKTIANMGVAGEVHTLESFCLDPASLASEAARATDLIVIARPHDAPLDTAIVHGYFATLLQETGRPILVVPSSHLPTFPPRRALVAWADTAESARALHDAMPLLEQCEAVEVLLVDPVATALEAHEKRGSRVIHTLNTRGIKARLTTCKSRGKPIGEMILAEARRGGAELIVAGGYGHGKVREWVLGGTTRDLFHDASIPVLFAH
jgi:nucleotide-binding universal stress UspA family protein